MVNATLAPSVLDYVNKLKEIDVVQEIRSYQDEDCITIMALVTTAPFDDLARAPVYEAQLDVIQEVDQPVVDFRVINLMELSGRSVADVLPSEGRVLWKRSIAN